MQAVVTLPRCAEHHLTVEAAEDLAGKLVDLPVVCGSECVGTVDDAQAVGPLVQAILDVRSVEAWELLEGGELAAGLDIHVRPELCTRTGADLLIEGVERANAVALAPPTMTPILGKLIP